jgi:hypothetical protein
MSAPAGWHLQPDGRERYWDGSRWTEQFRPASHPGAGDPTADPTAPASEPTSPAPTWDQTQALDVSSTQAIPAQSPYAQQNPYAQQSPYAQQNPYAQQPAAGGQDPSQAYGAPAGGYGAPAGGYGAPGSTAWPPPQRSGNGWLKGCLIALVVALVLGIAAVVAAVVFFSRAVDSVSDSVSSSFPSGLPSNFPSNFPSNLPSGLNTDGLGERVDITVGRGFAIPRARVEDGWSLRRQGAGALSVVTVDGMKATLQGDDGFPVLFTISLPSPGGEEVQTVCTAPSGSAGATVDVTCVPLVGDVADARRGTVTTTL